MQICNRMSLFLKMCARVLGIWDIALAICSQMVQKGKKKQCLCVCGGGGGIPRKREQEGGREKENNEVNVVKHLYLGNLR